MHRHTLHKNGCHTFDVSLLSQRTSLLSAHCNSFYAQDLDKFCARDHDSFFGQDCNPHCAQDCGSLCTGLTQFVHRSVTHSVNRMVVFSWELASWLMLRGARSNTWCSCWSTMYSSTCLHGRDIVHGAVWLCFALNYKLDHRVHAQPRVAGHMATCRLA